MYIFFNECCSMLQRVAVWYKCVADKFSRAWACVYISQCVLQCVAVPGKFILGSTHICVLRCVAVRCRVLQYVAVCVVVCCIVLQCVLHCVLQCVLQFVLQYLTSSF